jgi:hypothetical protein
VSPFPRLDIHEALRDLPGDLEERLPSAVKSVRSIPTAMLDSTALSD